MRERTTAPVKILLMTADIALVDSLCCTAADHGFEINTAACRDEASAMLTGANYELAVLDTETGQQNCYRLCRNIKEKHDIPVIFVSAADDEHSVVTGLEMGADDYIAKPCRPRELMSRIRTVLRRTGKAHTVLKLGNLQVDTVKGLVTKNDREIFLSALEYRIMLIFLSNRGNVLSRTKLLDEIWNIGGDYVNDNTLTVYIKRIREKIEDDPALPQIIKTVRGIGYIVGE